MFDTGYQWGTSKALEKALALSASDAIPFFESRVHGKGYVFSSLPDCLAAKGAWPRDLAAMMYVAHSGLH
jgi:hypothetical protein